MAGAERSDAPADNNWGPSYDTWGFTSFSHQPPSRAETGEKKELITHEAALSCCATAPEPARNDRRCRLRARSQCTQRTANKECTRRRLTVPSGWVPRRSGHTRHVGAHAATLAAATGAAAGRATSRPATRSQRSRRA